MTAMALWLTSGSSVPVQLFDTGFTANALSAALCTAYSELSSCVHSTVGVVRTISVIPAASGGLGGPGPAGEGGLGGWAI